MTNSKNLLAKAHLDGQEVSIIKANRSKNGEFFVKLKEKKRRISVWKLSLSNSTEAEIFFQNVFGVSYQEANRIHKTNKKKSALHRAAKDGRDALRRQIKKFQEEYSNTKITWGR